MARRVSVGGSGRTAAVATVLSHFGVYLRAHKGNKLTQMLIWTEGWGTALVWSLWAILFLLAWYLKKEIGSGGYKFFKMLFRLYVGIQVLNIQQKLQGNIRYLCYMKFS